MVSFFVAVLKYSELKRLKKGFLLTLAQAPSVRRSEWQEPEAADHTASTMRSREMMQAAFPLMQSGSQPWNGSACPRVDSESSNLNAIKILPQMCSEAISQVILESVN